MTLAKADDGQKGVGWGKKFRLCTRNRLKAAGIAARKKLSARNVPWPISGNETQVAGLQKGCKLSKIRRARIQVHREIIAIKACS